MGVVCVYVCMHIYRNVETGENPGVAALLLAQPGQKLAQSIKPLLSLLLCRDIFDDGAKRGPDVRLIVGNRLPYITPCRRREREEREDGTFCACTYGLGV